MDNKQQDALDTTEWGALLMDFAQACSKVDIAEVIKTNTAIDSFIRVNFEPKKEQSNDKP